MDHIIIFLNCKVQTSCKSAQDIIKKCKKKGVTLEWFLISNFEITLNEPRNLDLSQLYFGEADKIGFCLDSKSIRINTLLMSKEYIELIVSNEHQSMSITDYSNFVLEDKNKIVILSGTPGSGKSVCMNKLLQLYTGTDKESERDSLLVIDKIGAMTMYVNLNMVSINGLENILRSRQNDYKVRGKDHKFIYLFDGLDEVSDSEIDATLAYIFELSEKSTTVLIIISSRVASQNKYRLKMSYQYIREYCIAVLTEQQIKTYFENRGIIEKQKLNEKLQMENPKFFDSIQDVLTLSILWSQIDKIGSTSCIMDLVELSVREILNNINHTKYINELNIPNPKDDTIIELNKKISMHMFEKQMVSIEYHDLYFVVSDCLPKSDYKSLNRIVGFLAENFFDIYENETVQTFTYQHRRYAEYFLMHSIIDITKSNSLYLREKNLLSNSDFFYNILVTYLKNKALKESDLALSYSLGLYDVYLDKNKNWGGGEPYHEWSAFLMYAIVSQDDKVFYTIVNDDYLPFKEYLLKIPDKIIKGLKRYQTGNILSDRLNHLLATYFAGIIELYKYNKKDVLDCFLGKYQEITTLLKEKKLRLTYLDERRTLELWKNKIYIETVISDLKEDDLKKYVNERLPIIDASDFIEDHPRIAFYFIKALSYILTVEYTTETLDIIADFDEFQIGAYLSILFEPECMAVIEGNKTLKEKLILKVNSISPSKGAHQAFIYGFKRYTGQLLDTHELKAVQETIADLIKIDSSIFWRGRQNIIAFMSLPDKDGKEIGIDFPSQVCTYNSLYQMFINMLKGKCSLSKILYKSIQIIVSTKPEVGYFCRLLIGKSFVYSNEELNVLKGCGRYLCQKTRGNMANLQAVFNQIKILDRNRFTDLFGPSEVLPISQEENYQDIDYESTCESIFIISYLLSNIDEKASYDLLISGVNKGIMRLNQSKDTLGDRLLIGAFGILLKNNWISRNLAYSYVEKIMKIVDAMNKNNVSNDAWSILINVLIGYDFEITRYCYEKIIDIENIDNTIHFDYAMAMVQMGMPCKEIEKSVANFHAGYDNYYQKTEWFYYYGRLQIYLSVALSDFYSSSERRSAVKKVNILLDLMKSEGWGRSLRETEYDNYCKLCSTFSQPIEAEKEQINVYENLDIRRSKLQNNEDIVISDIKTKEELEILFSNLKSNNFINTFKEYQELVEKCLKINGNINDLIVFMKDRHYPDGVLDGRCTNLYMAVAASLKNADSKQQMLNYLLQCGGGHDGFYELIKAYDVLKDRHTCVHLFESFLNTVNLFIF